MTDKKEEGKQRFELIEVPTEMGLAFKDNESEVNLSQADLLVQIANEVSEIKKGIVGK